ncbi:MAG: WD40 repeat domain-containing protein [Myxococcaceae bacterium]
MTRTELRLGRNGQATARVVLAAAAVGACLCGTWVGAIDRVFGLHLLDLDSRQPGALSGPTFAGLLLGPLLVALILAMRQPKGAKVVLDDWGVTELDGEGVRTAIARGQLRHNSFRVRMASKYGRPGATLGGQIALTDEDGRRIDVCQGVQNLTLNKRLSTTDNIAPLIDYLKDLPVAVVKQQVSSESLAALGFMFGLLGYVGACLSLMTIALQPTETGLWFISVPAGAMLLLRSLAFWRPVWRGSKPDQGARPVTLVGGDGTKVQVKDGAATRWVELGPLKHPDAALSTRRVPGWIRTTPSGDVLGLETDAMRTTRRIRLRADRLEAWLRTLMALVVMVPGAILLLPYVQRESSDQPGLKKVWQSPKPVSGVALSSSWALLNGDVPMVLDARNGGEPKPLPRGPCRIPRGAISPDGKYVALNCDLEHVVEVWDPVTLTRVKNLQLADDADAIGFRPDGTLLTASGFGKLTAWSLPAGKEVLTKESQNNVQSFAISSTGRVALMNNEGELLLWDGGAGEVTKVQRASIGPVLAFTPDGKWLAVATSEVVLLDPVTGEGSGPRLPYTYPLKAIAFSADSKRVAIGGDAVSVFTVEEHSQTLTKVPLTVRRGFGRRPFEAVAVSFDDEHQVSVLAYGDGALFRVAVP